MAGLAPERTVPGMTTTSRLAWLGSIAACSIATACAVASHDQPGEDAGTTTNDASTTPKDSGTTKKDAQSSVDAYVPPQDDASNGDASQVLDAGPPPKPLVYGHSPDTLFTFDTTTNLVTEVAAFSGCSQSTNPAQVLDLAIDSQMNAFATTVDGLYSVDLGSAQCTLIKTGSYPNSLSFVPAGTLDPNVEALVGYFGSVYMRVDTSNGNVTSVGTLTGGYASSGDIVSVSGGGSFLTVTGNGCGDCLLQVDPTTGNMIQNYGALPHGAVYGLGYWAGTLFGFDQGGDLFAIGGGSDGGLAVTDIVVDGGVTWWGAGSTTIAPATSADGGAIPTQ